MRHRSSTTVYGQWIKLVKKTNPKTGRKHYTVIVDAHEYYGVVGIPRNQWVEQTQHWRDHFDPAGNRGMKTALSFKFVNREQAEQLITLALLKWGAGNVAN